MDLKIDLVPHVGQQNHHLSGELSVEFDQYSIVVGGEQFTKATGRKGMEIGLVGKAPGAPINFLNASKRFPSAVLDAVAKAVEQKLADKAAAEGGEAAAAAASSKPRRVHRPMPDALAKQASQAKADEDTAGSKENL